MVIRFVYVKSKIYHKNVKPSYIMFSDELLPKRNYYAKLYNFVREISDSKQRCSIDEKDTRILKNNTVNNVYVICVFMVNVIFTLIL